MELKPFLENLYAAGQKVRYKNERKQPKITYFSNTIISLFSFSQSTRYTVTVVPPFISTVQIATPFGFAPRIAQMH